MKTAASPRSQTARDLTQTDREPTLSEQLAHFTAQLEYDAIPERVRERASLHFMDSIGIAFAASGFDFAKVAHAGVAALGSGPCHAIGLPGAFALRDAVLLNGMLVHGIEYDDTAIRGRVHASAFCVPNALGAAESVRASGKSLLCAYVAGMEASVRIGIAAQGGFSRAGYNTVGLLGAFGGALVAGKLLGLDAAQLTMAQGIAYSTAAGNREFTADDSWTKRFEAGWPGVGAITAVMLARAGYKGPRTPYEGKYGLYRNYLLKDGAAVDTKPVTDGLGETWEFEHILLKMLPSCYFNHPLINSTLALVRGGDVDASRIRGIRVFVPAAGVDTVCEPRVKKLTSVDVAAAQFSAYFSVACAAVRRRFTLDDLDPASCADPAIRSLAAKVQYVIDTESNFPAHYSGGVEITMDDGRVLRAREDVNRGSAELPLAASDIEEKFLSNAGRVMPRARAQELQDSLLAIEKTTDVSELVQRLAAH